MVERQVEYELRKQLSSIIEQKVEDSIDRLYDGIKENIVLEILNAITVVEKEYKKQSEKSIQYDMPANEMLILVNPLREAVYWYIQKILLKTTKKIKWRGNITVCETEDEQDTFEQYIINRYDEYKRGVQIKSIRNCISKIEIKEENEKECSLYFPSIDATYNKEMIYYYGLDDSINGSKEREIFVSCEQYLLEKFDVRKVVRIPNQVHINLNILTNMTRRIDKDYYDLCKKRIASDVNKISSTTLKSQWKSTGEVLIASKEELISVLAMFYYLSRICMQKYMLKLGTYQNNIEYHCSYDITQIISLASQIGITKKVILNYVEYFTLYPDIKNGGFAEFPLIRIQDAIIWIPSSFALNDFQFSIVNGHYIKDLLFVAKDDTVSQSIVDYIINKAAKYSNIISAKNVLYNVPEYKFNGKDLKSDIDVALYDIDTNSMIIIECKWKENVYINNDDYPHIDDAFTKIFDKQLDKHKYYLNLSSDNVSRLFDNKIDFSSITEINTLYLFVDKRIQYHDMDTNRHAVPIFMLAYLFDKYNVDGKVNLNSVMKEIQNIQNIIKYEKVMLQEPIICGDITVK